jgi:type IV pilus assembly protein PilA
MQTPNHPRLLAHRRTQRLDGQVYRRAVGDDRGFTLIELLVVVTIIGVLAGIAISVFLHQRVKGYDAAAKSDLRNLAAFEEIYLNDYNQYGTIAQVRAAEPDVRASHGVTVTLVDYIGLEGYCFMAKHRGSPNSWYYDSEAGGIQPVNTTCVEAVGGTPGDTLTG